MSREESILDNLGQEVTGIAAPVSICMAITVLLVRTLNPYGHSGSNTVYIASIAYEEHASDSSSQKFYGAVLNALVFVAIVTVMTFVLFYLFKHGYYKFIFGYMAFSLFIILFFLTGALLVSLIRVWRLHVDTISFLLLLYNFSVVGCIGLFFIPTPLLLKQMYLVWVGVTVAYMFTFIPEWTSWVLLCLMAIYDIVAVLMPGGPLKVLVELAMERQQELPALIYEARPVGRGYQRGHWRSRQATGSDVEAPVQPQSGSLQDASGATQLHLAGPVGEGREAAIEEVRQALLARTAAPITPETTTTAQMELAPESDNLPGSAEDEGSELAQLPSTAHNGSSVGEGAVAEMVGPQAGSMEAGEGVRPRGFPKVRFLLPPLTSAGISTIQGPEFSGRDESGSPGAPPFSGFSYPRGYTAVAGAEERAQGPSGTFEQPLLSEPGASAQGSRRRGGHGSDRAADLDQAGLELPDSIRLGLGDFIFYSMLVGRAAMYDMLTVFAAFFAIIAGLGATLLCLAFYRHALPALPFSIALGVCFYFASRILLEPYLVPVISSSLFY